MNALEAWLLKPYKVHIISQMSILNCCNRPKQTQSVHIIHTKCTFHENPPTHCIAGTAHRIWEICERKSRECFYMIHFSCFTDLRERNKKYFSQQLVSYLFCNSQKKRIWHLFTGLYHCHLFSNNQIQTLILCAQFQRSNCLWLDCMKWVKNIDHNKWC